MMVMIVMLGIRLAEAGLVPDFPVRRGIRRLLAERLRPRGGDHRCVRRPYPAKWPSRNPACSPAARAARSR